LTVRDDQLHAVELADGRLIPRAAVFMVPTMRLRAAELIASIGCELDDGGFVRADPALRTSVPGVWVAGNATNPRAQVITAAGEGSTAGIAINADLVQEDIETALHRGTLIVNH
jgi:thioredoxin reductase